MCTCTNLDECVWLRAAGKAISPIGPSGKNGVLTVNLWVGVLFCSPVVGAETKPETDIEMET